MEIKRFSNIIAIKPGAKSDNLAPIAFHSNNLEVAELDEILFTQMIPIQVSQDKEPSYEAAVLNNDFKALNEWNDEVSTEVKSGRVDFGINNLTLNVNQICNLKCVYCAAGGDGTYGEKLNKLEIEKTLPQLKFFLSRLKPGSTFAISFVGGEPLLYFDGIESIYKYVVEESKAISVVPKFKIVTNGTLFTDEILDRLANMKLEITVSLDGTKEVINLMRPSKDGKNTADKIFQNLKKLIDNRGANRSIHISSIFTRENKDIVSNFRFLYSLGADTLDFVFENSEKDADAQLAFINGYREILAELWRTGGEAEIRRMKTIDHYFNLLDNQQKVENHCGAGKSYLMIDSKNRIYTCVWDANNREAAVGIGLELNKDKLDKLSKPLVELNNCGDCWARNLCGGGCMYVNQLHNGNKHLKSKLFCERTRSLILEAIVYYKLARSI